MFKYLIILLLTIYSCSNVTINKNGNIPDIKRTLILRGIQFDSLSYEITDSLKVIDQIVRSMNTYVNRKIYIVGSFEKNVCERIFNCDSISLLMAFKIKEQLVIKGINANRITTSGSCCSNEITNMSKNFRTRIEINPD